MSDDLWPDTDELVELLVQMNITMDPSELQGVLLGRVAGAPTGTFDEHWDSLAETFGDLRQDPALEQTWQRLINVSMETLAEGHMELELSLPEEEEVDLPERLEALAAWCRGFLFGVGISGASQELLALQEIHEVLEDVKAISQVGMDDSEPDDQDSAYTELLEYLRMVPFQVYTTLYNVLDEQGKGQREYEH